MDVCHLFPQCLLAIIPLLGGVTEAVAIRVTTGCCAVPPLCSVVVTVLSGAGSPP